MFRKYRVVLEIAQVLNEFDEVPDAGGENRALVRFRQNAEEIVS